MKQMITKHFCLKQYKETIDIDLIPFIKFSLITYNNVQQQQISQLHFADSKYTVQLQMNMLKTSCSHHLTSIQNLYISITQ